MNELWGSEISPHGAVIRVDLDESRLDTNLPADRENEVVRGISPIGVGLVQPDGARLTRAFGGSGRNVTAASEGNRAVADAIVEDATNIGASS